MKSIKAILLINAFLFLISPCYALTGSIRPARMILYPVIKSNEIALINSSVEINNANNISVTVNLSSYGNIYLEEEGFELQPNETRRVNFTIFLLKEGDYNFDISAQFSAENEFPVGVGSEIIIHATANETATNNNPPSKPFLLSPSDGMNLTPREITLSWEYSNDPDSRTIAYYYEVDNSNDFSSPEISGWTLKNSKRITPNPGEWYWRITASDGLYNATSDTRKFYIAANYTGANLQTTTTTIASGSGGSSYPNTTLQNNGNTSSSTQNPSSNITGLTGSIRPPRMILRGEAPCNITGWVDVSNVNDFPIFVETKAIGDFSYVIKLSEKSFTLGSNETRRVNFTIPVAKAGNYTTEIYFIFSPAGKKEPNLVLSSEIMIFTNQSTSTTSTTTIASNPTGMSISVIGIGAVALVAIIAIFMLFVKKKEPLGKRMVKKWRKEKYFG